MTMEGFYDEYGGDGDERSWLRMIMLLMMMVIIMMKKEPHLDWRLLGFNDDGDNDDNDNNDEKKRPHQDW